MAKLQRFMSHAGPRTTQRYYDHIEVDHLEASMSLVPDLGRAISGSKLAMASAQRARRRPRRPRCRVTRRLEVVETKGLEPSTFALRTRRSTRLSYVPTGGGIIGLERRGCELDGARKRAPSAVRGPARASNREFAGAR